METFKANTEPTLNYRIWLSEEFTKRCKRNPRFSMRAYADLLGLHSSTVSQLLSGKRKASAKMIKRLSGILGASPEEEEGLINFCNKTNSRNQVDLGRSYEDEARQLSEDAFAIISDWYHYAILEFTFAHDFKSEPRWIGTKLGITTAEAKLAIDRLKRLGLIAEVNGKLVKTEAFITNFSTGVTSAALKKLQRQILMMGIEAIENTPQEEKDITSMTMAVNPEKLPEAREIIKKCRRDVLNLLEKGKQERIYHLGIQLYPVSKK